ncbi:MAG: histidine kinase dimerization/phospho-acceptor domain-containing protein, partial [Sutterellaceae bacterium]|nr:histidine kinase dimerization/phospho-acceptor domain-containing protein [Sutterellaceae bacterium]
MATSIRSKIVFTLVSALVVAGLVASWATYYSTRSEFSDIFDSQLRQTALELVELGDTNVQNISLVGQSPQLNMLVQIYDARDNRIYTSRHAVPLPISETPGFTNVITDSGKEWRQYTSTIGTKIIQVAQPTDVRDDLAVSAAMRIVQPMFVLIPFLAIAIWFVIVQMLQPLNRTAKAVAMRSPSSLQPIEIKNLPFELKSLVDAINALLVRLGDSLSAQQRFASDAAHELRTPLAAIKLQAQLLERAKDPETRAKYAGRLQQGVARATRLVEQLLTIARLDPDAAEKPMSEVDLAQVAK